MSADINTNTANDSMNREIFKPVFGYEENYLVSNLGRIKSLKRSVALRNHE